VTEHAKGVDLSKSARRDFRARGEMDGRVRAAAWKLLPQINHRQHLPGGHCRLLVAHELGCASRKSAECDCDVYVELDLPGKN
jgi:hypothetical protein